MNTNSRSERKTNADTLAARLKQHAARIDRHLMGNTRMDERERDQKRQQAADLRAAAAALAERGDALAECQSERLEQARLLGMSAERELKLRSLLRAALAEREGLEDACRRYFFATREDQRAGRDIDAYGEILDALRTPEPAERCGFLIFGSLPCVLQRGHDGDHEFTLATPQPNAERDDGRP